jgi:putative glycosyltransferase
VRLAIGEPKISVVTSLYRSSTFIVEFFQRMRAAVEKVTHDAEFIFVNDGSPDDSLEVVLELAKTDDRVVVVDLSRNFGHHPALLTGLETARGELIFTIDCDLEEPPELFGEFYQAYGEHQVDVVYGYQVKRKGGLSERLSGYLFWKLINLDKYSVRIPENPLTLHLMSRRYVSAILSHRERVVFLAGIYALAGFAKWPLAVKKASKGSSVYTFRRKLNLFMTAITSFTMWPLMYTFYLGLIIALLAAATGGIIVLLKICSLSFHFKELSLGWPSLLASVWFLGGCNIFSIGLIGIYLSQVFTEVKARPVAIVREVYRKVEGPLSRELTHQEVPDDELDVEGANLYPTRQMLS